VGKNGAGKSTVIRAILGLIRPDSGQITINGKELSRLSEAEKARFGAALSDSGFSSYLRVEDIVCILRKMYPAFDERFFRSQCTSLRLPFDRKIKELSAGMRAKLRVLVAISHRADLLILDEPTAGLDAEARNDILDLLRQVMIDNDRCSILLTSHISSDLEGLCDEIYLLHDGKIVLHEDTDILLSNYAVLKVREENYETLDKRYLLSTKKESFGYLCFTNEKQFYAENYPGLVMEKGKIDDLILMM
jgi:ABC-2 type transport system ATP-binding protein